MNGNIVKFNMIKSTRKWVTLTQHLSSLSECDFQPPEYKELDYDSILKIRKNNLHPSLATYYKKPLLIHSGYKQWLFDQNNKRYLDMFAGIVTVSVGHCHPKVNKAAIDQLNRLGHTTNIYLHPKIHEYAIRLTEKFPGNLKVAYFVNSGSEANELAILLARLYTKHHEIISLRNGYHGASGHTTSLTGQKIYKFPTTPNTGIHQAMNPNVYTGIWGGKNCRDSPVQTNRNCFCSDNNCEATDKYVDQFKELLDYSMSSQNIAGFFAESIQGVGGTVQFPKGYIKKISDIVRSYGGVYIADEVQTGFGRTGDHYWGFESHDVIPDIVTMAKGIGNGFPLAAVVTTPEIAQAMTIANHFNTFGGNPVACAVGIAVLDVIEEEKCQELSKEIGTYLLKKLEKLRDEYDIVGDVRGKGLMIGVEMVQDQNSRKPISAEKMLKIWEECKDNGLLIGKGGIFGNVFRIKPPMCITKEDADFTIKTLRLALENNC